MPRPPAESSSPSRRQHRRRRSAPSAAPRRRSAPSVAPRRRQRQLHLRFGHPQPRPGVPPNSAPTPSAGAVVCARRRRAARRVPPAESSSTGRRQHRRRRLVATAAPLGRAGASRGRRQSPSPRPPLRPAAAASAPAAALMRVRMWASALMSPIIDTMSRCSPSAARAAPCDGARHLSPTEPPVDGGHAGGTRLPVPRGYNPSAMVEPSDLSPATARRSGLSPSHGCGRSPKAENHLFAPPASNLLVRRWVER